MKIRDMFSVWKAYPFLLFMCCAAAYIAFRAHISEMDYPAFHGKHIKYEHSSAQDAPCRCDVLYRFKCLNTAYHTCCCTDDTVCLAGLTACRRLVKNTSQAGAFVGDHGHDLPLKADDSAITVGLIILHAHIIDEELRLRTVSTVNYKIISA